MSLSSSLRIALGLALALSGPACSSAPAAATAADAECDTQILHTALIASPELNFSSAGESRPVQVRLYQLKNDVKLLNASFAEVWKTESDVFGEDMVAVQEVSVFPDSRVEVEMKRNPEAQFIVAAALFREPKGTSWFYAMELPPPPGEASCRAKCVGPECAPALELDPKFFFWLSRSTIEDGAAYADQETSRRVDAGGKTVECAHKPKAVEDGTSPGARP